MAKYVPSPRDWVREQVELYESSGGTYERSRLWKLAIAAYPPYADTMSAPPGGFRSLLQSGLSEVAAKGEPDDREALAPGG